MSLTTPYSALMDNTTKLKKHPDTWYQFVYSFLFLFFGPLTPFLFRRTSIQHPIQLARDQASRPSPQKSSLFCCKWRFTLTVLQFSFSPDPRDWGSALSPDLIESDDEHYKPLNGTKRIDHLQHSVSLRGLRNAGCLTVVIAGFLTLLLVLFSVQSSNHHADT